MRTLLLRLLGVREDGYILRWRGNAYLRLPKALTRPATVPSLPDESPLLGDEFFATKQEASLSIMDEDTHGFVLLILKKDGSGGDMAIHGHMPAAYQTALYTTLVRMLVEGQRLQEKRAAL